MHATFPTHLLNLIMLTGQCKSLIYVLQSVRDKEIVTLRGDRGECVSVRATDSTLEGYCSTDGRGMQHVRAIRETLCFGQRTGRKEIIILKCN